MTMTPKRPSTFSLPSKQNNHTMRLETIHRAVDSNLYDILEKKNPDKTEIPHLHQSSSSLDIKVTGGGKATTPPKRKPRARRRRTSSSETNLTYEDDTSASGAGGGEFHNRGSGRMSGKEKRRQGEKYGHKKKTDEDSNKNSFDGNQKVKGSGNGTSQSRRTNGRAKKGVSGAKGIERGDVPVGQWAVILTIVLGVAIHQFYSRRPKKEKHLAPPDHTSLKVKRSLKGRPNSKQNNSQRRKKGNPSSKITGRDRPKAKTSQKVLSTVDNNVTNVPEKKTVAEQEMMPNIEVSQISLLATTNVTKKKRKKKVKRNHEDKPREDQPELSVHSTPDSVSTDGSSSTSEPINLVEVDEDQDRILGKEQKHLLPSSEDIADKLDEGEWTTVGGSPNKQDNLEVKEEESKCDKGSSSVVLNTELKQSQQGNKLDLSRSTNDKYSVKFPQAENDNVEGIMPSTPTLEEDLLEMDISRTSTKETVDNTADQISARILKSPKEIDAASKSHIEEVESGIHDEEQNKDEEVTPLKADDKIKIKINETPALCAQPSEEEDAALARLLQTQEDKMITHSIENDPSASGSDDEWERVIVKKKKVKRITDISSSDDA